MPLHLLSRVLPALAVAAALVVPAAAAAAERNSVRVATFNASLNRSVEGELQADLATGDDPQAQNAAETIQRIRPDIVLVNEFDFDAGNVSLDRFAENYLEVGQRGAAPIRYPYRFTAESNTGIPTGLDLNNDGKVEGGDDAFGFGLFPGQYGMAVYSRFPIDEDEIRTFQKFRWKDMPGNLLPTDFYDAAEQEVLRLSSKSHWDIPIDLGWRRLHLLASHPTPPTFDGPEDRNGRRNHDEIRFWADYVRPNRSDYIYDDEGNRGGLHRGARFVIAGDQNADPEDGDSYQDAILQLLDHPKIQDPLPTSAGGPEQAALQGGANLEHEGDPAFDTADFSDRAPGNLRVDYVLPSARLRVRDAGVFWPEAADPLFRLVGTFPFPTSDHRLVWVDLRP